MRGWLTGGVIGMSMLVLAGGLDEAAGQDVKKTGWYTDYAAARAAARQNGKPLLVVFRCQP